MMRGFSFGAQGSFDTRSSEVGTSQKVGEMGKTVTVVLQ